MKGDRYDDVKRSRKEIIFNNFIGGVSWAIGTIVGAGLFLAILGLVITKLENVDLIGPLVMTIMEKVEEGKDRVSN
ncbi:hypothetical protein KBD45_04020 [Candidatus Dojkabacteria bacterium]|nr:hypothetical protein [Candidatus Dojkabacteria bacterium]